MEETHYYPFGLTMAAISSKAMGRMENHYKLNSGAELNNDLGVAIYETSFRGYDAQTGRFAQIDPMADSYTEWSPYSFAFDDPVYWNDPLGAEPNDYGGRYSYDGHGQLVYSPFSSAEEAFLHAAKYASIWSLWGSDGMAGSFDQAWTSFNGGLLTGGMTAAYFSMLWGGQVSGVSAGYADGGYNLSYTATSTGNTSGGLFFSMEYIGEGIDRMIDVDRSKAPLGEDMTSPSDWLYQWNNMFNFVAPFANAASTYVTGHDTYGVTQSNTQVTAGMLFAFFPAGKVGRLGNAATKTQIADIALELENRGYTIIGGGGKVREEYLRPLGGGRRGGSYIDITATHPSYGTLRINTVDVYKNGMPTMRELNNAARIRSQIAQGERLLLIPKS